MIIQALIPVAGIGTRLLPITRAVPKELLPIGPKSVLQWIAEEIAALGVEHLCLVTSEEKKDIDRLFRPDQKLEEMLVREKRNDLLQSLWCRGPFAKTRISLARQSEQLGLGHAVLCAQPQLTAGPFLLALGDCLMGPPGKSTISSRLVHVFHEMNVDAVIAFEEVSADMVARYGIAAPVNAANIFRLKDIVEKPQPAEAPSNLAVAGRYVFSDRIFDYLKRVPPGKGGEIQLTDAIRLLIRDGGNVFGIRLASGESRIDVGNYQSYARAFIDYALRNDNNLRLEAAGILKGGL